MYVRVHFRRKGGEYGGAVYTYNCVIKPKVGDLVKAPTARGDTPAKIIEIGVPYEEIDSMYRDNLRTITERYEEPQEGTE